MQNVLFTTDVLYNDTVLSQSFNQQTQVYQNSMPPPISDIDFTNVTHIAFMYHHPGYAKVPFFYDDDKDVVIDQNTNLLDMSLLNEPKYNYFSDKLVNLFKYVKTINENIIIDLLTCDLNEQSFIDEVNLIENDLGVNIRYSIDKTGNNPLGNWVLESDNVDVKNIYFNENINNWNVILAVDLRSLLTSQYSTYFSVIVDNITSVTTIKLLSDITITDHASLSAWGKTDFISLGTNEIFDGDNHIIKFDVLTDINGLFSCSATTNVNIPIVRNLGVTGGSTAFEGAFIVRGYQKFMVVENCYSTGNISTERSGGIIGRFCAQNGGLVNVSNCYSTGNISGLRAGGIVGGNVASSGTITVSDCYSTGVISNQFSGGIIGSNVGNNTGGSATVINCYSIGLISGDGSGGIIGAIAGNLSGSATVTNCYSTGEISGIRAGGIMGRQAGGNSNGNGNGATATNCYSTGAISGLSSGGIFGITPGGFNGSATANNCYSTGAISGIESGGITGSNAGIYGSSTANNCYSTGNILGDSSGGIMGSYAGYGDNFATTSSFATAIKCYSTGIISGIGSGGIMGSSAGYTNYAIKSAKAIALNCYSTGNISGESSGGIMGSNAGTGGGDANATTTNCYSAGAITASINAGGIFGANKSLTTEINSFFANGGIFANSTFLTNLSDIYSPVTNSFPILKSFQSLPWLYTSTDLDYYNFYTKSARLYTTPPIFNNLSLISSLPYNTNYSGITLTSTQKSQITALQIILGTNITVDLTETTSLSSIEKFNLIKNYGNKVSNPTLLITKTDLQTASGNNSLKGNGTYAVINSNSITDSFISTNNITQKNLYFTSSEFTINGITYTSDNNTKTIKLQGTNIIITRIVLNGVPYSIYAGSGELVSLICFAKGTPILTPNGNIPIEDLKKGDNVITGDNRCVEIKKVFYNKYGLDSKSYPVVIPKGFNGCTQETLVSFKHAILINDKFIQAGMLGLKRRIGCGEIEYYNLKLEGDYRTDTLVVNGLVTESWGNSNESKQPNNQFTLLGN